MSTIDPTDTTSISSYSPPVDKLLTIGEPDVVEAKDWPNYLELGLTAEHIPALIRMATDKELEAADSKSLEVWAPIHARRALGQLNAIEAVEPLLALFDLDGDSEWVMEELPEIFQMIGPQALPALEAYLMDGTHKEWSRVSAATSVQAIGMSWPDARSASVAILSTSLENSAPNETELSSFIVTDLIGLQAKEAAPVIEQAFKNDRIDLSIVGNWDDVRESLGLMSPEEVEQRQADKLAAQSALTSFLDAPRSPLGFSGDVEPTVNRARAASHKKAKNKMAKQSRKKNRKR